MVVIPYVAALGDEREVGAPCSALVASVDGFEEIVFGRVRGGAEEGAGGWRFGLSPTVREGEEYVAIDEACSRPKTGLVLWDRFARLKHSRGIQQQAAPTTAYTTGDKTTVDLTLGFLAHASVITLMCILKYMQVSRLGSQQRIYNSRLQLVAEKVSKRRPRA